MAWKYNNTIIRAGRSWTDSNGIKHPTNWMNWSDAEKTAAGMVWENDPASYDDRFYWDANTPKTLGDTLWVDDNDDAIIDPMTGVQGVTLGLKSEWKAITKTTAGSLLEPSDWMVIKASEVAAYTVPSANVTYRAAVRTASNTIETAIDGATDIDAFIALFDVPVDANNDPTGKAPIHNWPDEI